MGILTGKQCADYIFYEHVEILSGARCGHYIWHLLAHISLASFLRDICKQCKYKSDAIERDICSVASVVFY